MAEAGIGAALRSDGARQGGRLAQSHPVDRAAELLDARIASPAPCEDARRGGDALAAICYTGTPKGVMLSRHNLPMAALGVTAGADRGGDAAGRHIAPVFHGGGMAVVMQVMLRRAPHVLLPVFDPAETLRLSVKGQIGDMFLMPTLLPQLLDHPYLA